ncbi:MAG TPA: hypothetical protein PLP29_14735 [Candidatus Ozemobacteraceae bacterium]|nr:hypothetical protein [Candidatus Ozemobacteraceae bacterium]
MNSPARGAPKTPFEELVIDVAGEEKHGHGSHWSIFSEDSRAVVKRLPEIVRQAKLAVTHADNRSAKAYPMPATEPKSVLLSWPIPRFGLLVPIRVDDSTRTNEVASLYPWSSEGVQHTIRIEGIRLWNNRLEAQLDTVLLSSDRKEGMPITFFDPLFCSNRVFYSKCDIYEFILTGFPYVLEIADPKPLIITDPTQVRLMRQEMYPDDPAQRESIEPVTVETGNMACFIQREDFDRDDYEFQGPVKSVAELHTEILGQKAWRVRVTISRLGDEEIDIDLCLTKRVLGEGKLPEIGDSVRGVLWLQGRLWRHLRQ